MSHALLSIVLQHFQNIKQQRNGASNIKMENKAENCNLTSSAQLYGIEKQFQHPQDMLTALESPGMKARHFPNFKWIQSFLGGGNCFSM